MSEHDHSTRYERELAALRRDVAQARKRANLSRQLESRARNAAERATAPLAIQGFLQDAARHAKTALAVEASVTRLETRATDKEKQLRDAREREAHRERQAQDRLDRKYAREQEDALIRMSQKLLVEQERSKRLAAGWISPAAIAKSLGPKKYDVFISHAWEDKNEVARPLFRALKAKGLAVWFDEATLSVGDSLRTKIEEGVAASLFGVVILSHNFFQRRWPKSELNGLYTKQMSGDRKVILPIWHNISKDEIEARAPMLADTVGLVSALMTTAEMASAIHEVVQSAKKTERRSVSGSS